MCTWNRKQSSLLKLYTSHSKTTTRKETEGPFTLCVFFWLRLRFLSSQLMGCTGFNGSVHTVRLRKPHQFLYSPLQAKTNRSCKSHSVNRALNVDLIGIRCLKMFNNVVEGFWVSQWDNFWFLLCPAYHEFGRNEIISLHSAEPEWPSGIQCHACCLRQRQSWVWALNLHQCFWTCLQVCGSKRLSCHATSIQSGVPPEVNLRIIQVRKHARDPPWLWNPGQTSPEVQNRGISGPHKEDMSSKSFKKKFFVPNDYNSTVKKFSHTDHSLFTRSSLISLRLSVMQSL